MIDRNTTEDTGIAVYLDSSIPGPNDAYLFLVVDNGVYTFSSKRLCKCGIWDIC